jgi:hypothetical protein
MQSGVTPPCLGLLLLSSRPAEAQHGLGVGLGGDNQGTRAAHPAQVQHGLRVRHDLARELVPQRGDLLRVRVSVTRHSGATCSGLGLGLILALTLSPTLTRTLTGTQTLTVSLALTLTLPLALPRRPA